MKEDNLKLGDQVIIKVGKYEGKVGILVDIDKISNICEVMVIPFGYNIKNHIHRSFFLYELKKNS